MRADFWKAQQTSTRPRSASPIARATAMHPQQPGGDADGVEGAWRCRNQSRGLEDADGGCFVGLSMTEYGPRTATADDYSRYRIVGLGQLGAAGRISHSLGLNGPSLSIESACASSLTALLRIRKARRAFR
jgi:mycobactin polyketide synthetase MbtC